ncbi:MAG: hypothetical protein ACIALR_14980 [Blastopirellula sp. JB062]
MALILTLVVLNLPIYWLIGWVMFDTTHGAVDSFWETTIAILKAVFVPRYLRVLTDDESDGDFSVFNTLFFLVSCVAVVAGEYYLLTKYLWPAE